MKMNLFTVLKNKEYKTTEVQDQDFRAKFMSQEMLNARSHLSETCQQILDDVESEASYYPIAESTVDKSYRTTFVNSWMAERTYGGERGHEGIDIMASVNKRGIYPVVSMTDGVITNLGWLEKGGYRVGITSESGAYYYYAHLDSYTDLEEGQRVRAGEVIGYMGDSGYGPEGTTGKFAVHLHLGIYLYNEGKEISVNPYYLIVSLENKKLKYAYS